MDLDQLTLPGFRHLPPEPPVDHPAHAPVGITPIADPLYVVTMLENPIRWRSRYRNYWAFEQQCAAAGAVLYTCEIAFADRDFEITSADNPRHLQLRTRDELWHKENALNVLIGRLPADAKYVAWIDADVQFARSDWAQETVHRLQHYDFVQMWSVAQDLGPDEAPMSLHMHRSFMACYEATLADPLNPTVIDGPFGYYSDTFGPNGGGAYWHPGFAWAARIPSLEKVGMLIDWAILGSGDWHMANALVGNGTAKLPEGLADNYRRWILEWQARAERYIQRNVGHVPGLLLHHYHGAKIKRHYGDRWSFLINANFDPVTDIKRDRHGLWQLNGHNPRLRDGIRTYNRMRDEDA